MNCKKHSDREAIGACVKCGNFFCEDCLIELDGRNYCKKDSVALINQTKSQSNSTSTKRADSNNSDFNNSNKLNNEIGTSHKNNPKSSNEQNQTKENTSMPIKLNSPNNFPNELKNYNIIYIITGILFAIFLGEDLTIFFAILFGLATAFMIVNIIINFKVGTLRTTKYYLPGNFSKDEIVTMITLPLTQLNMTVENSSDSVRITHNKLQYDISFDQNTNTFTVWVSRSLISSFLLGRIYIDVYSKAICSMPIIIHTIQFQIEKALNLGI